MDSVPEEWRAIPGYPGYEASSLGRIRSVDRVVISIRKTGPKELKWKGRVLKENNCRGYRTVCVDGASRSHGIHRLVALTFIGPWVDGMEVDHLNGNKLDNRLCNLEYVTRRENITRAIVSGRIKLKLTPEKVREIREQRRNRSFQSIADEFGISTSHAKAIVYYRKWAHVTSES